VRESILLQGPHFRNVLEEENASFDSEEMSLTKPVSAINLRNAPSFIMNMKKVNPINPMNQSSDMSMVMNMDSCIGDKGFSPLKKRLGSKMNNTSFKL
jgi:hypothetical protein